MRCAAIFFFSFFLVLNIFEGCSPTKEPPIDQNFVKTYAELGILYEKEKIVDRVPDSTYRNDVADFFSSHHITEKEFNQKVAALQGSGNRWLKFLSAVTNVTMAIKQEKK
jgi:hypothetical protein